MRHLFIAGAIVLTSAGVSAAQTPSLAAGQAPLNLTLLAQAQIENVFTQLARLGGITIEFDATVTDDMRRATLAKPITLRGATLDQAISAIASSNGLTYTVTGPKAVRISKKV